MSCSHGRLIRRCFRSRVKRPDRTAGNERLTATTAVVPSAGKLTLELGSVMALLRALRSRPTPPRHHRPKELARVRAAAPAGTEWVPRPGPGGPVVLRLQERAAADDRYGDITIFYATIKSYPMYRHYQSYCKYLQRIFRGNTL